MTGTVYKIYLASLCVQVNTLVVIIIREGRLGSVVTNGSWGKGRIHYTLFIAGEGSVRQHHRPGK